MNQKDILNQIIFKIIFFSTEEYAVYIYISRPGDVFVYRYQRRCLLLLQVNTENKDVLSIYTSNHGQ
jgi:hypothetical protein